MASKRMFSLSVIDSDAFLDMPLSTQALYFHLCMRADDDGFVDNPKKIQRIVRATEDDLRVLMTKQFVIPFETGVLVIKHWKVHNVVRKDMYKKTLYQAEKALLQTDDVGVYHSRNDVVTDTVQECIETVTDTVQSLPIDKNRLDKDRLDNNNAQSPDSAKERFEYLWDLYPNKKGKKRAYEAFQRALKKGTTVDQIREGIKAYNRYIKESGIEPRFIKQGSTFFMQEAWNDDWTPTKEKPKNQFNQFEHNQYDFDELEREIVGNA